MLNSTALSSEVLNRDAEMMNSRVLSTDVLNRDVLKNVEFGLQWGADPACRIHFLYSFYIPGYNNVKDKIN